MNNDPVVDEIRHHRGSETVVRFRAMVDVPTAEYEQLDSIVRNFGLMEIGRYWREISREGAVSLAASFLSHDLAYHARVMSDEKAAGLARQFIGTFADDARFFTNTNYSAGATSCSWTPLTESTFDAGVLGVSASLAGILVVQDED